MSVIRNAIFLVLIGVGARAAAHDFWIQPTRWEVGPRESFQLRLEVGHGPYRQRSPIAVRRVIRFEAVARLLDSLVTTAPPRNRQVEADKGRARGAARFGPR